MKSKVPSETCHSETRLAAAEGPGGLGTSLCWAMRGPGSPLVLKKQRGVARVSEWVSGHFKDRVQGDMEGSVNKVESRSHRAREAGKHCHPGTAGR